MPGLSIQLFGLFDIKLNGEPISGFRSNKARALLAYLAVEANRPIPRTTLATLLWGDYPDAQARKSLRNTIANLRQLLAPLADTENLIVDRQTVQLRTQVEQCTVDVAHFDELIRTAQSVSSEQSITDLFSKAVALYQGELLVGLPPTDSPEFEEWRVFQQELRHRQVMDALNTLTANATARGDYTVAAEHARHQIQLEPWQERAHQQLMHLLATQGDRSAALAQFDLLTKVLDDELGVGPSVETVELYEEIRDGDVRFKIDDLRGSTKQPAVVINQSSIKNRQSKILSRLDPLPDQKLFGIERAKSRLLEVLLTRDRPWLVAIDGIGGIGKTTLATALVHEFIETDRFDNIAWISAKQEEFRPAVGIAETGRPALDAESLTDGLLEQLMERPPLTASSDEKRATLMNLLKEEQLLVIVDNLESVADYQALVPYLRQLANPSTFLITTRLTLQSYSDIFCYSLTELGEEEAIAFLRHEAGVRNIARLVDATQAQFENIYHVVGGNPLALQLVMGQVRFLALAQVLENLQEAQGKKIDQLYVYIYWQAWEMLDEASRQLFLSMPAVDDGTFMELSFASALDPDDLQEALSRLMDLSLVQIRGDLDEPRYRLHRLTETFLMNEVLKWQSLG